MGWGVMRGAEDRVSASADCRQGWHPGPAGSGPARYAGGGRASGGHAVVSWVCLAAPIERTSNGGMSFAALPTERLLFARCLPCCGVSRKGGRPEALEEGRGASVFLYRTA